MAHPAPEIDRIAPTRRPPARPVGYHRWHDLLFVHWRVEAGLLEPLLPGGLSVDTWDGDAWVGLVAFHLSGVRPWWSPPLGGISAFREINVRTYVQRRGADPGVWFFSLDATSPLAVCVARLRWRLNYFRARMELLRTSQRVQYASRRLWPGPAGASVRIEAELGTPCGGRQAVHAQATAPAQPGTLEHFLVERYLLYTRTRRGRLLSGQVHHAGYPLREARLSVLEESLLAAAGIRPEGPPSHVVFSDGVDVEIFPLAAVA